MHGAVAVYLETAQQNDFVRGHNEVEKLVFPVFLF
jgi:hypothetical protein